MDCYNIGCLGLSRSVGTAQRSNILITITITIIIIIIIHAEKLTPKAFLLRHDKKFDFRSSIRSHRHHSLDSIIKDTNQKTLSHILRISDKTSEKITMSNFLQSLLSKRLQAIPFKYSVKRHYFFFYYVCTFSLVL